MTRHSYSQRYPQRARFQTGIALISLLILALPLTPPVTITIGTPSAQATIYRGSAR